MTIVIIHQNQSVCNNSSSGGGSERIRISIHRRRRPTTRHPLCAMSICVECISRAILGGKRFGLPELVSLPIASRVVCVYVWYVHISYYTHTGLHNATSVGRKYILRPVLDNNCFLVFSSITHIGWRFLFRTIELFLEKPLKTWESLQCMKKKRKNLVGFSQQTTTTVVVLWTWKYLLLCCFESFLFFFYKNNMDKNVNVRVIPRICIFFQTLKNPIFYMRFKNITSFELFSNWTQIQLNNFFNIIYTSKILFLENKITIKYIKLKYY